MYFDRFDIVLAHLVLEYDYNVGGILQERPSNKRRNMSTGYQIHRIDKNFHKNDVYTLFWHSDNAKAIYWNLVDKYNLQRYEVKKMNRIDTMLGAYLDCIAWVDCVDDQDENFENAAFSDELLEEAKNDCKEFLDIAGDKLTDNQLEQAGHDLWLTRNGHGAGFWDRGDFYNGHGDYFTSLCEFRTGKFQEKYVYVGDDNLIYFG